MIIVSEKYSLFSFLKTQIKGGKEVPAVLLNKIKNCKDKNQKTLLKNLLDSGQLVDTEKVKKKAKNTDKVENEFTS